MNINFDCDGLVKMLLVIFLIKLRSAIQCIRGAHFSTGHYVSAPPLMNLVRVESNLTIQACSQGGSLGAEEPPL